MHSNKNTDYQLNTKENIERCHFRLHLSTPKFTKLATTIGNRVVLLMSHISIYPIISQIIDFNTFLNIPVGAAFFTEFNSANSGTFYYNQAKRSCSLDVDDSTKCSIDVSNLYIILLGVAINSVSLTTTGKLSQELYPYNCIRLEVHNEKLWKQCVLGAFDSDEEATFTMFREMYCAGSGESAEVQKSISLVDEFPEDCFTIIMLYCDVRDWMSFSLANSKCLAFANRVIWKLMYYQMTGSVEIPEDQTYMHMCSRLNSQPYSYNFACGSIPLTFSILSESADTKNIIFKKVITDQVFTLKDKMEEYDDDYDMGFGLFD